MNNKYINPYTDFGFKKLFGEEGSKDLLVDFLGDELTIESLSLTLWVEEIYQRVKNKDVSAFYEEQKSI